eukprot:TRINITY_DN15989_c0_g2_i1.p2 TRINITY_DN15989_c0_g2~~TRINITY_DN15989_c0_g2_i1.p2  ORF type:complete len:101 (-),score=0.72 TRINITY_DN15989_c0_g2_i1:119-421(-)
MVEGWLSWSQPALAFPLVRHGGSLRSPRHEVEACIDLLQPLACAQHAQLLIDCLCASSGDALGDVLCKPTGWRLCHCLLRMVPMGQCPRASLASHPAHPW